MWGLKKYLGIALATALMAGASPASAQAQQKPAEEQYTAQGLPLSPMLRDALAIQDAKAARDRVRIVGSSSMAVFTEAVAKDVAARTGMLAPTIETSGTREGIRTFCAGIGAAFPDIIAASRRMTKSEYTACLDNGIADIIEVPVGLDAVLLVTEKGDPVFGLSPRHIYLALAAEVPRDVVLASNVPPDVARSARLLTGEDFMENPFKRWSEIDGKLPDLNIRVWGPSVASGTRDFVDRVLMEGGCRHFKAIRSIPAAAERVVQCTTMREAPYFNTAQEPFTEKVIAAVMEDDPGTLGIVTFDTYDRFQTVLDQLPMMDLIATEDSIARGEFPFRRHVYYYVKRAHMRNAQGEGVVRGLREFMANLTREEVIGPGGLLDKRGLVPLPDAERAAARQNVGILKRLER